MSGQSQRGVEIGSFHSWLLHSKNATSGFEIRAGIERCFDIKLHIMHFPVFFMTLQNIETPQLCPMCQTSHQMSDMVENINDEGSLDFFCSNRCMMVHKAQSVTVSGTTIKSLPSCNTFSLFTAFIYIATILLNWNTESCLSCDGSLQSKDRIGCIWLLTLLSNDLCA